MEAKGLADDRGLGFDTKAQNGERRVARLARKQHLWRRWNGMERSSTFSQQLTPDNAALI